MDVQSAPGARMREWRTGWPLVLSATIGVAMAGMHYPVMGTMMRPLTAAYGWTRGEAAFGLTIASLIAPLANVFAGVMADRFGPRRVVLAGTMLFGLAYAAFALAGPALWGWYAASASFALCGHFVGPVVWTMAVVRHFSVSRGLALALTLSGSGVIASIMPAIVLLLLDWAGVRCTFVALAAGASLIMFVPALFLFRIPRRPDGGLVPANGRLGAADLPGLSVARALGGTLFWRLAVALLLVAATVGMFIVHLQSMLIDSSLSPVQAASAAFMIGPAMIAGRLGTGLLFDRLPARLVAGGAFSVLALACALMLNFDGGMSAALVVAAVTGLGVGAEVDVVAFLTSRYFGLRRYGALFGVLIGVYGIGVGTGSAVAGQVFDRVGNYDAILLALGAGCLLAGLLAATLGRPDPEAAGGDGKSLVQAGK